MTMKTVYKWFKRFRNGCELHQSRSNIKVMMIVFFDLDGIVRAEFVPRNTTVNSEYYKGLLEHLRNNVHRK